MNVPVIVSARLGFGRDMWGIKPRNITESLKWLYVAYFMYMLAECLCQLSLLAFYLRIMVERRSRLTVWVFIGLVTGFGIGNVIAMIFQCTPIVGTIISISGRPTNVECSPSSGTVGAARWQVSVVSTSGYSVSFEARLKFSLTSPS
jgi:hypothetical protein